MTRIQVIAGQSVLEGYVKTPGVGLCELIWNAFDEDAENVEISADFNALGGLDALVVSDDGNGFNHERAKKSFSTIGDSWKRTSGTVSTQKRRPVHGKHGRGRYAAFSLGASVRWESTAEAIEGGDLAKVVVKGSSADLRSLRVSEEKAVAEDTGTLVTIEMITDEAKKAFTEPGTLRTQILTEFALHLQRFPDFSITLLGERIDPAIVIESEETIEVPLPEGVPGSASITVIEWDLSNVERRLYLVSSQGSIVDELPPGVQAPGAEFTAYLKWDHFHEHELVMEDPESPAGKVVTAARDELRTYLAASARRREAETLSRWKSEGVYPFKNEPRNAVEEAARDVFDVVAMAAARTVEDAKSPRAKALALSLLRQTLESDPEALVPIMQEVARLSRNRIEELQEILERTTLSHLIQVGKEIGSRVDFLQGLEAILFEAQYKKRLLERRQLHRILANETWIFGEEWSLTGDDESLDIVLQKHRKFLGDEVELTSDETADTPVRREDGSIAIPDLVLGRKLETNQNVTTNLVVELKRPNYKLALIDINQITSYASAITNDERFHRPDTTWDFWLIGNETTREVDEQRNQAGWPVGLVQDSKNYKIWVKTWSEIIGSAQHRMKFVQRSLQFESGRDAGLAQLRKTYAGYLPTDVPRIADHKNDDNVLDSAAIA